MAPNVKESRVDNWEAEPADRAPARAIMEEWEERGVLDDVAMMRREALRRGRRHGDLPVLAVPVW